MSRNLVIGSSGYIGTNLIHELQNESVTTVTRNAYPLEGGYSLNLSSAVLEQSHPLFYENPERVYILSRPCGLDPAATRTFYANLQQLLLRWCENADLKSVFFTSTSTVYSIEDTEVKNRDSKTSPYSEYEYFKLETELFLEYLFIAQRSDIDFYVFRLPIAFGGIFSPENNSNQYIYSFISDYKKGLTWEFHNLEEQTFGTSWVFTPDLVRRISRLNYSGGSYRIVNVASGFFTYRELHEMLLKKCVSRRVGQLRLYRSRMEIENEFELESRSIEDEIGRFLGLD